MISVCLIEYYEYNAEIASLCNGNKASGSPLVCNILHGVPILFYTATHWINRTIFHDKSHLFTELYIIYYE